ncbi:hypothetical protein KAM344_21030 [Aeromonas caviae]|uniref:hypothetical protein n=1 Tax=Aeromonas caviae TaxID=648 RepID=UPI001CC7E272|nr:hypothetical protein [Aeromonas caviae]GJA35427.1 hypothetical protein KAM342_06700 [Aeromonas caviae]GJA92601.1 hypothetical protein KAM358_04330 [Aeromonas caviae]GKQ66938.1 hypothetical protein KAM344_21030 [Aeromonas caviae]
MDKKNGRNANVTTNQLERDKHTTKAPKVPTLLALVAYLERSNATLLDAGMEFAERKARLAAMLAAKMKREGLA